MYNGMDCCIALRLRPVYIRVHDLGARLPGIHMAVYDTYIYNYKIYSNKEVRWCGVAPARCRVARTAEGDGASAAGFVEL